MDQAVLLNRCEHGVYQPKDIEGPNPFCSGCHPSTHMVSLADPDEKDSDEVKERACPICSSLAFEYRGEDDYLCPQCGFSVGDII